MSEMSKASAAAGGDPVEGLPDEVDPVAATPDAEPGGPTTSGEGSADNDGPGDATDAEALSAATSEEPTTASDPMPDVAGTET